MQFADRRETAICQRGLARQHGRAIQIQNVNDAQMNFPDGCARIVDQPQDRFAKFGIHDDFFRQFAGQSGAVGIGRRSIDGIDVSADANRAQRPQPSAPSP